jgi:Uncharacterised protein family (UPF0158)
MAAVQYSDLELAFEFVSSAAPMENMAYVSLDTGRIYWISSWSDTEDELPDDVETSDRYVRIPHKNDLDLGKRLVLRFMDEKLPSEYDRVQVFFHHRGAYARFRDLLAAHGAVDKWHAYEDEATDRALREWCAENGIEIVDDVRGRGGQE